MPSLLQATRCAVPLLALLQAAAGADALAVTPAATSPAVTSPAATSPTASAPAPRPTLVTEFILSGNTVFSSAQLAPLLHEYVGRELTFELIDDARRKLTDYYIAQGYVTSGAILPEQNIVGGIVHIQIIEGQLERLDISGNSTLSRQFFDSRLALGNPLQIHALQESLEVLQQDPRIADLQGRLLPGSQPGLAVFDLKVDEARPYQVAVQFDNQGTPSTGAERLAMIVSHLNLTGVGDSLVARFGPFSGGVDHPEFSPASDLYFEYTRPILGDSTSIILFYARNDLSLIQPPLSTLGSTTVSNSAAISLLQTILHTPRNRLDLILSVSRRDNHTTLLGQDFSFSDGAVNGSMVASAVRMAAAWTTRSDAYVISARSTLSLGIDAFGATIHGDSAPDSQFVDWLGEIQSIWKIQPIASELLARVAAQVANDRLLPVEQFSLGGAETVRGYRENTLLTDNALFGSLELRHALWSSRQATVDGALFTDFGYAWDHDNASGAEILSSVGCGLLFTVTPHVEGQIYFGVPLSNRTTGDNLQDLGIHFQLLVKAF